MDPSALCFSSFPPANFPFDHDTGDFPLVRVKVRKFQTYDLPPHFGQMLRYFDRGRAGFVYDIREARVPTHREAQLYAQFFRDRGAFIRERCAAGAVVTSSALHRGVLASIHWMCPIPFPIKTFACPRKAEDWVRDALLLGESTKP